MADRLKCITPVDGSVYVERALADHAQIETALERARRLILAPVALAAAARY